MTPPPITSTSLFCGFMKAPFAGFGVAGEAVAVRGLPLRFRSGNRDARPGPGPRRGPADARPGSAHRGGQR
nr:hypothetical protein [Tanacetum cinerariifolium]